MSRDDRLQRLAREATRLAKIMPASVIEVLAHALGSAAAVETALDKGRIVEGIANPHHRSLAVEFLDGWWSKTSELPVQAVAAVLVTAAVAEQTHQKRQVVELVWTGPDAGVVPLRRTEQALLQVIDSATERLLVVSYAVYNIPRICEALLRAADRNVAISVVVESPDRNDGRNAYSNLAALGPSVASRCSVYLWPIEERRRDGTGKPGILHVKCAVADGRWLFLSSANLTEYAFTLNMELGVLITGGHLPERVARHFEKLIEVGQLTRV
jgi:phosphatidylserine/phosphatidylglycerophosphate/cardiolipin synthase-like enzyme